MGGTCTGCKTVFYSHTHTVITRNLGLPVCRLLFHLLHKPVALLEKQSQCSQPTGEAS